MVFQQTVLALAAILVVTMAAPSKEPKDNLMSFIANSSPTMQKNPSRSLACFSYYIPYMHNLAGGYETSHIECEENFEKSTLKANDEAKNNVNDVGLYAYAIADALKKCKHETSSKKAYQCYINSSSESLKFANSIKYKASGYLFQLEEELLLAENEKYRCTNSTQQIYEKENGEAMADINRCIIGEIEVPITKNEAVTELINYDETNEEPIFVTSNEFTEIPEFLGADIWSENALFGANKNKT